ncbi:hypothetical protein BDV98DRAFT_568033 [Pterulicium gracile]|uniref:Uncharacterized protein n=1 Tax=Pterulicium gracile TaxID=1884261 RepID=A0A5C3QH28_9AGAR|nr:hypothetical protein BDV98DRAFT_568033 [Pterula gracilis]
MSRPLRPKRGCGLGVLGLGASLKSQVSMAYEKEESLPPTHNTLPASGAMTIVPDSEHCRKLTHEYCSTLEVSRVH